MESVVIAPAERYAIDVSFAKPGRYSLVNRVRAIDHLYGRFFDVGGHTRHRDRGSGTCRPGPVGQQPGARP